MLLVSGKISTVRTCCLCSRRSCSRAAAVIVAEDVEGEALSTLVVNKIRGTFVGGHQGPRPASGARPCWPTSILTGGQVISEDVGLKLENTTLDLLGQKIIVTKDETTIVEGAGSPDDIQGRIKQIKNEIENTDSDYDREKLQERLAKLSGGVAVLKVGAPPRSSSRRRSTASRTRCPPPRRPSRRASSPAAAPPSCGRTKVLDLVDTLSADESTGARIVARALEEPLKQIAVNAGLEGGVVAERVRSLDGPEGLNADSGDYEDLTKAGIIDAAKVTGPRCRTRGVDRGAVPHHRGRHRRQARGDPGGRPGRRHGGLLAPPRVSRPSPACARNTPERGTAAPMGRRSACRRRPGKAPAAGTEAAELDAADAGPPVAWPSWTGPASMVRHGESVAQERRIVGGHKGCQGLSQRGRAQVEALRDRLAATDELDGEVVLYASLMPRSRPQPSSRRCWAIPISRTATCASTTRARATAWRGRCSTSAIPTGPTAWHPDQPPAARPGTRWRRVATIDRLVERHAGQTVVVARTAASSSSRCCASWPSTWRRPASGPGSAPRTPRSPSGAGARTRTPTPRSSGSWCASTTTPTWRQARLVGH